jgi:hypothetical protein
MGSGTSGSWMGVADLPGMVALLAPAAQRVPGYDPVAGDRRR